MVEETPAQRSAAPLQHAAELLICAYRALCRHPQGCGSEEQSLGGCPACSAIAEVRDMVRVFASSVYESTALCAHFERELIELRNAYPPRTAA